LRRSELLQSCGANAERRDRSSERCDDTHASLPGNPCVRSSPGPDVPPFQTHCPALSRNRRLRPLCVCALTGPMALWPKCGYRREHRPPRLLPHATSGHLIRRRVAGGSLLPANRARNAQNSPLPLNKVIRRTRAKAGVQRGYNGCHTGRSRAPTCAKRPSNTFLSLRIKKPAPRIRGTAKAAIAA